MNGVYKRPIPEALHSVHTRSEHKTHCVTIIKLKEMLLEARLRDLPPTL